jgi:hypothetical protein
MGTKFDPNHEDFNRHILRVLRVRNRFNTAIPTAKLLGGYRDIGLKMEFGFSMTTNGEVKFLPCKQWNAKDRKIKVVTMLFAHDDALKRSTQVKFMVVELQLRFEKLIPANFKELHARYVASRDMLSL